MQACNIIVSLTLGVSVRTMSYSPSLSEDYTIPYASLVQYARDDGLDTWNDILPQ